jgi:hypothetical protein
MLDVNVLERENLTKYEVHLKIDNLNVEDMFERNRTEKLLDIFRSVCVEEEFSALFQFHVVSTSSILITYVTCRFLLF